MIRIIIKCKKCGDVFIRYIPEEWVKSALKTKNPTFDFREKGKKGDNKNVA